ncbi:flagellar filament capping protein FliD [Aquincola sp. MAHUQ-54]|uniref:Flagellar hook-associated protein 2 n=1 Tax=Aquincola agrisoli TaxID=3119538 RepID=A0AAW9QDG3_9BURK
MAITSIGIGSGLKVEELITGLMDLQRKPLELIEDRAEGINARISAFGSITSAMEDFRSASVKLAGLGTWNTMNGSTTNDKAVGVTTSTGASAGNYAVTVQHLATSQSISTKAYASATSYVGSGKLNIDIGSWDDGNTAFTAKSGNKTLSVEVSATDTLTTLRDKINALGSGVNASILNDASGARLVINSRETGATNGFRITAEDSDGGNADNAGLSAFAFDPPSATTTTLQQSGTDAQAKINGLAVTSASNTLTNVVEGVTLTLAAETTAPVSISVKPDTEGMRKTLDEFVTAYNDLSKLLSSQTKYDSETKTAGALQGDSTALSLQRQLRGILGAASPASSAFPTLSAVGIEIQRDGTLTVDDTKFNKAVEGNLAEVRKLFTATDLKDNSRSGIGTQLRKFSDSVLSVQGMLSTRTESLNDGLDRNLDEQDRFNAKLENAEKLLRAQYTALDTRMASLNSLSAYITQQITSWNQSK